MRQYVVDEKIKITGNIVEFFKFQKPIKIGGRPASNQTQNKKIDNDKKELDKIEIRKKSLQRAKSKIIDLINTNQYEWVDVAKNKICNPIFLTLTFKENKTDIDSANNEFTKFIKRFNYKITGNKKSCLKYISIIEFQKRGAVHYHIIFFNLPFIKNIYDELEKLWGLGYFIINKIDNLNNIGHYICKYLTKNIDDKRLMERKSYFISKNLIKPTIFYRQNLINPLYKILPKNSLVYQREYKSEYCIKISLEHFNLKEYPKEKKLMEKYIRSLNF